MSDFDDDDFMVNEKRPDWSQVEDDQDFDFEYEDEDNDEPDVDLENRYYNAKGAYLGDGLISSTQGGWS